MIDETQHRKFSYQPDNMPVQPAWSRILNNIPKFGRELSVPVRLNILNMLVVLSGLLSIVGAYEIQLGAKMHELNYQHQKYTDGVAGAIDSFENGQAGLASVRAQILLVQEQPIKCLEMIGNIEHLIMTIIGTGTVIDICIEDEKLADNLLTHLDSYANGSIDKNSLIVLLKQGVGGFLNHGAQFQPAVEDTVSTVFFLVITIIIAKAFLVPLFGFLLSSSVSKDYTTLIETKSQLLVEQNQRALVQAERMTALSTMVAGIAHEINTPVGISVTASSHIREHIEKTDDAYKTGNLTEEDLEAFFIDSKEAFDIIENNLGRTSELVKSFKQVSVDRSTEDERLIELNSYLDDILTSLKPITKTLPIQIKVKKSDNLYVETYPGVLSQIVTNLVTNAIIHAFPDGRNGMIEISFQAKSDGEMHLTFGDNGCGISTKDIKHIFDPFFTTKRGNGGTGLGLHILHNLVVDKLNGEVTCQSTVNEGTQFLISFPCSIRDAQDLFI